MSGELVVSPLLSLSPTEALHCRDSPPSPPLPPTHSQKSYIEWIVPPSPLPPTHSQKGYVVPLPSPSHTCTHSLTDSRVVICCKHTAGELDGDGCRNKNHTSLRTFPILPSISTLIRCSLYQCSTNHPRMNTEHE